MHHWLQLATRNWRAKPGRALAVVLAVALGVGTVITVTSIYASVEAAIGEEIVEHWLGQTHLSVESPRGHWGSVDQALVPEIAKLKNVERVTARLKTRMWLKLTADRRRFAKLGQDLYPIDVVGIDPRTEYAFRAFDTVIGRRINPGDHGVLILEQRLASELGYHIGEHVPVVTYFDEPPRDFEIIGLIPARRVAIFQKPTVYLPLDEVQAMRRQANTVSVIDAIVRGGEPKTIEACAERVRAILRERKQGYIVTTATGKIHQLREAQRATRLVLLLFAFVALLTSFFIILTTMSMGMMERVRLLGALRCVGVTRGQLAALVYAEVLPLGVAGIVLGLPVGYALTRFGVAYVPHIDAFVQKIVWSAWGVGVATIGGFITTLAGATAVLWQGACVSPMRAVNPQARADRTSVIVAAAVVGGLLLTGHALMIDRVGATTWLNPAVMLAGMMSLYGGYMLIAPGLVLLVGTLAVNVAAPLLGVRHRLAQDQVGRAPWRSAGVCWALMVGLSLIVFFFVRGESFTRAWDFPARLAGTFVWTRSPIPQADIARVAKLPGVGDLTPINDVVCKITPRHASILSIFSSQSVFVAGDLDTFLAMAKLEFLQGNLEDARAKLDRGGYVLLPPEASHSFGYNLGDKVPVTIAGKTVDFEVAGVVRSPAMDIAVSYFQADSYMMLASAGSALGTLDDLRRHFNIDTMSMFLMDIKLPPSDPPPAFSAGEPPPTERHGIGEHLAAWAPRLPLQREPLTDLLPKVRVWLDGSSARLEASVYRSLSRYGRALREVTRQWHELSPEERWGIFREQLVLENVKALINRPDAMTGSLRRLKQDIDRDIRIATLIISAIPMISLIVASLGVANLMMVNVNSRARQFAILRAVGSTQSQIARLVLVEAVVLGLLGSAIGVALGLHAAWAANALTMNLIGIEVPWTVPWLRVAGAVAITWLICLAAGIAPALRASRRNIISALQVS